MSRPELTGHASLFYDAREAKKYDSSSRMVGIQREITERAIELLKLDDDDGRNDGKLGGGSRHGRPRFVLDVGCGSGLSGQVRAPFVVYGKQTFFFLFLDARACFFALVFFVF